MPTKIQSNTYPFLSSPWLVPYYFLSVMKHLPCYFLSVSVMSTVGASGNYTEIVFALVNCFS